MKQQMSLRIADDTRRQLEELTAHWNTTQTEVIAKCVDRIYQQESKNMASPTYYGITADTQNVQNHKPNWFKVSGPCEKRDQARADGVQWIDSQPGGIYAETWHRNLRTVAKSELRSFGLKA